MLLKREKYSQFAREEEEEEVGENWKKVLIITIHKYRPRKLCLMSNSF